MSDGAPRRIKDPPKPSREEDDIQAASKATTIDYDKYMPKLRAEHKLIRRLVVLAAIIVILGGLGTIAYIYGPSIGNWYTKKPAPAVANKSTVSSTIAQPNQQYSSNNQNLSFSYPTGWQVSETSNLITVTSVPVKLTNYDGKSTVGRVVMTISNQTTPPDIFNGGNPMAVIASQVITYKAPAAGQRGSTYISFLNYTDSKVSGIDGIYITGNTGYKLNQYALPTDFKAVNPIIAINFLKCANNQCSGKTSSLTLSTNSWNNATFSQPLTNMLTSLVLN